MNLSLPDALKKFVDERVASRGYSSRSEYVRDLIRRDEMEAAKDELRGLIRGGLESGSGRTWEEIKSELLNQAAGERKSG